MRPRGYESDQGRTYYFCGGRVQTSKDAPWVLVLTLGFLLAGPACWLAWESPYLCRAVSLAPIVLVVYFWISAVAAMLRTALTDPGILPRNVGSGPDLGPPDRRGPFDIDTPALEVKDREEPLERVDDGGCSILGNSTTITRRWCTSCRLYRPPRCSHCRSCDNCVDGLDHHCVFLNACIGRRNYTTFYAFLCHTMALLLTILASTICKLYFLAAPTRAEQAQTRGGVRTGFVHALQVSPQSAVFFFLGIVWLIPTACLWVYHTWLLLHNRSTVEQIRLESTNQLYDMHRDTNEWMTQSLCARSCSRFSARVRNLFVAPEYATPLPSKDAPPRPGRRTRGPFQFRSSLKNARQVLGYPLQARYLVGSPTHPAAPP
ncbi:Similar to S.cerevisiae protein ERF2 (Subunit of a palmitoyltransferase) [Malassezia sympodialis ATCC 42132]|uniref:Palmitoyltransferase n=1 Tax=Malassezia sympodialis (strain ATCC 42132) TaxID=1230383 RepID=A0A1M8A0Q2_MALS4|nr:Similar to S.cerevisiae protein ERF2 (Subunit of a palmitoyltransferase) [Malassezia sympodialis ATCC 42132]